MGEAGLGGDPGEEGVGGASGGAESGASIQSIQHLDKKIILQGAQDGSKDARDGVGWTVTIMEDTGRMVLTASGDMVGFVGFGACTLPDK